MSVASKKKRARARVGKPRSTASLSNPMTWEQAIASMNANMNYDPSAPLFVTPTHVIPAEGSLADVVLKDPALMQQLREQEEAEATAIPTEKSTEGTP